MPSVGATFRSRKDFVMRYRDLKVAPTPYS